jgi:hypothetical protein
MFSRPSARVSTSNLWRRLFGGAGSPAARAARRPRLEALEDRLVPATLNVTDTSDLLSDTGSLRYQLAMAQPGDTIQFAANLSGQTISLNGPLAVTQGVNILGPAGGAVLNGGGLYQAFNIGGGAAVTIDNLTFTACPDAIANSGNLALNNDVFSFNSANGGHAGAVSNTGTLTAIDCTFTHNTIDSEAAAAGAAIYNSGSLSLQDSTFVSNQNMEWQGAVFNGGTLGVIDCTFSGNSGTFGGGIFSRGSLTVSGSAFLNNGATQGGGIFVASVPGAGPGNPSVAIVADCTFAGNNAMNLGSALCNVATLSLLDSTVAGNVDGIYTYNASPGSSADTFLSGCIVAGNQGKNVLGPLDPASTANLVGAGAPVSIGDTNGNLVNVSNPGLAPLGYYGGPTETFALLPGSPAIGANSSFLTLLGTDQRGVARPASNRDMGAFQTQNGGVVVTTPLDAAGPLALGQVSLRQAVAIADAGTGGTEAISFDSKVFGSAQTIHLGAGLTLSGPSTSITGPAAGLTLDGGYQFTVLTVTPGAAAGISSLTIAHGAGGVSNAGTLSVSNCAFVANADEFGGAVDNTGTLTLSGSTFTGNYAGLTGGAIYNRNTVTASGCTFSGNATSSIGLGGAVDNIGTFSSSGDAFSGNYASAGGAVSNSGYLADWDDSFVGNSAAVGGAVYNVAQATVYGAVLESNAAQLGGAVFNYGTLAMDYCFMEANSAVQGGAVYSGGWMMLYGNDIYDNYLQPGAGSAGGGVYNTGTAYLNGNWVAYNWAANYSGIDNLYGCVSD